LYKNIESLGCQMNQLLLLKLRTNIIDPLAGLVEWDRYGIKEDDDSGFIFGWIRRDDKFYDFVLVRFWVDWNQVGQLFCSYDTSSKKYSKEIGLRLGSNLPNYTECRSAREIVQEQNLIKWQKLAESPHLQTG
jgi:hypothetical protein